MHYYIVALVILPAVFPITWNHKITKVGRDLQDHPVQPSTCHQYFPLNHVLQYNFCYLLVECLMSLFILVRQSVTDPHQNVHLVGPCPVPY